jgi:ABC-2 type transport system permease protein
MLHDAPSTVPDPVTPTPQAPSADVQPSPVRAWLYLVWLSWQRQARARQMVLIALGLLVVALGLVGFRTALGGWGRHYYWRGRDAGPDEAQLAYAAFTPPSAHGLEHAVFGAARVVYDRSTFEKSSFLVFSYVVIFEIFLAFLLPIFSLSFATEALGGERESNSLLWLLTRPLPRSAIYLAKFVAVLPWCLALNLGGFVLLCAVGGPNGQIALRLYWPAVIWATLAFSALFFLMGAFFRRPAVVAIVYSFFLEIILGNMPGYLKRLSISFYARCMMFQAAEGFGVQPEKPTVYLPVDGPTALAFLLGVTVGLTALGMLIFSRTEYREVV